MSSEKRGIETHLQALEEKKSRLARAKNYTALWDTKPNLACGMG
jgi:hypothetical protein